jgi:flagellar biosynthesis protein FlhG
MRLAMVGHGVRKLVTTAMDQRNESGLRTPLDLLREIESLDGADGARFVQTMREFRPRIVVNNVRTAEDIKLGFAMSSVCRKYFGIDAEYLGYVNQDDDVRLSIAAKTPLVEFRPESDASIYLERIARKVAAGRTPSFDTSSGSSSSSSSSSTIKSAIKSVINATTQTNSPGSGRRV